MMSLPPVSDETLANPRLVSEAFTLYHRVKNDEDDWDDEALHASDLAKCSREVWARRNGEVMLPDSDDAERKMRFGVDFEATVGEALVTFAHERGLSVREQAEVFGLNDGTELVGHPDFLVEDLASGDLQTIEVKATTFQSRFVAGVRSVAVPKEPAERYVIQAAANAIAHGAPTFRVVVACRQSGMMVEFIRPAERYEAKVRALQAKFAELTAIGAPEPVEELPPAHIKSWACRFCRHAACENNSNPMGGTL